MSKSNVINFLVAGEKEPLERALVLVNSAHANMRADVAEGIETDRQVILATLGEAVCILAAELGYTRETEAA